VCACVRSCGCGCPGTWACACARARVPLLIERTSCMRRSLLSFVTSLAPPYFSTLFYKRHDFRKEIIENRISFWISLQFYVKDFSFCEEFSEILSQIRKRLHTKYQFFLPGFNKTWIFSTGFRKKHEYQIVVPCGRTDRRDIANSLFSQFCERA
jgi:hypothetical protein